MTILLYDYLELEEKASKHLKAWKVCHLILYISAAIFGITNYVFLQNTMALVDGKCVFYPRTLEFRTIELTIDFNTTDDIVPTSANITDDGKVKRDATYNDTMPLDEKIDDNVTALAENKTHRLVLDTSRMLFESESECEFAEYMPVMSTVFAAVWITMFTMCAGGGRVRTGLMQPWRILAPALLFALVMVGLTGRSFTITNGGLHAFCAEFHNITNSTACSSVNPFLEFGWNTTWGFGGRAAATRATSAGAWASWACAAALLLARCLTAPDFLVRRTGVYLAKDPHQKVTPYLKKSRSGQRAKQPSPTKIDNLSLRSEPTATTELVTASVEHDQDSVPTSLMATPVRAPMSRNTENIELAYSPQERLGYHR